jgi:hypothetical protein
VIIDNSRKDLERLRELYFRRGQLTQAIQALEEVQRIRCQRESRPAGNLTLRDIALALLPEVPLLSSPSPFN